MAKKTVEARLAELEQRIASTEAYAASFAGAAVFMVGCICDAVPSLRDPVLQRLRGRLGFQPTPDPEPFQAVLKYLIRDIETMKSPPKQH
jgi:hypothetical protein